MNEFMGRKKKSEKEFYSNENIEWHCIQLELKFDSIKFILRFNSKFKIQLKKNGMQIGAKDFENFLLIMELKKKIK
jgi:hypothetical protein